MNQYKIETSRKLNHKEIRGLFGWNFTTMPGNFIYVQTEMTLKEIADYAIVVSVETVIQEKEEVNSYRVTFFEYLTDEYIFEHFGAAFVRFDKEGAKIILTTRLSKEELLAYPVVREVEELTRTNMSKPKPVAKVNQFTCTKDHKFYLSLHLPQSLEDFAKFAQNVKCPICGAGSEHISMGAKEYTVIE